MSSTIAVVGGTGLIGWQIACALRDAGQGTPRILSRLRPRWLPSGVEHVVADVTEGPVALAKRIDGCRAIVNAASYVGDDSRLQEAVNVDGFAAVVEAAKLLGELPIVHMSTAGVYGTLTFSGGDEASYPVAPESSLSRSRAQGDAIAQDAQAVLVRPLFVTGVGDTHFLLPLLRAHAALGAWIEGGEARLSVTSAEHVGRLVAEVVARSPALEGHRLLHAVPAAPISVRQLVGPILSQAGVAIERSISLDNAIAVMEQRGVPARKVAQFTSDYFITSSTAARHMADEPAVSDQASRWYLKEISRP